MSCVAAMKLTTALVGVYVSLSVQLEQVTRQLETAKSKASANRQGNEKVDFLLQKEQEVCLSGGALGERGEGAALGKRRARGGLLGGYALALTLGTWELNVSRCSKKTRWRRCRI